MSWTQHAEPPKGAARRLGRLILPVGLAVMAAAAIAIAIASWNLRANTLRDSRNAATNLAAVLAAQTRSSVRGIDNVLREIQDRVSEMAGRVPSPEVLDSLLRSRGVHDMLALRDERLPQTEAMAIVGADGAVLASSRTYPFPRVNVADREYFRFLSTHDTQTLFIAKPVSNRANGQWTIYLARRWNLPDGRFGGLVLGGMPLTELQQALSGVVLPAGGSVTLLRSDGVLLARYPGPKDWIEERMPEGSAWQAVAKAGGGSFSWISPFDIVSRQVTVHLVPDYPLVVDLGIEESVVLAQWWRQAEVIAGVTGAMMLGGLLLLELLRRQIVRQDAARLSLLGSNAELVQISAQLAASRQHTEAQARVLQTVLETVDQGLVLITADRRVGVCNRKAIELLDIPPDVMAGNPSFDEVLEYQWRNGEFALAEPDLQKFLKAGASIDRPGVYERQRPDGRVIEVRSIPLPEGGAVRSYTDITLRRQAEERIRHLAHHDDLTQLANRAVFNQRLASALAEADRDGGAVAVMYLDLDHFKEINDTRGHEVGDTLLTQVAARMRAVVRGGDTVARMGGDEFAILQPSAVRPDGTMALAQRLLAEVAAPYPIGDALAVVGVSIGIAWYPADAGDAETLLRRADAALYAAKRAGRNTIRCHDPEATGEPRT